MKRLIPILILLAMAGTAGASDPNLVAWYKMNDNAATAVVVDSQAVSNGTSVRDTNLMATTGKIGGALSFNGTSDYVDSGNTFQATETNSFSVNAWVNLAGNTGNHQDIVNNYVQTLTPPSSYEFEFFLVYTGGVWKISTYLQISAVANSISLSTTIPTPVNSWNMYTTVITETGSDTTIDLYMNGVLVGTMTAAKTMASFAMTQNLYLGAGNINGTPGYFLSGSLDDVMIFNKALTQAEIAALYGIGFTKQKQNQYSFRRHNQ